MTIICKTKHNNTEYLIEKSKSQHGPDLTVLDQL